LREGGAGGGLACWRRARRAGRADTQKAAHVKQKKIYNRFVIMGIIMPNLEKVIKSAHSFMVFS
jgi:hypothetical protein